MKELNRPAGVTLTNKGFNKCKVFSRLTALQLRSPSTGLLSKPVK